MIVKSGSVSVTAVLRLGLTAGLSISLPDEVVSSKVFKTFTDAYDIGFGAGIIAGILVDVAQLKTATRCLSTGLLNCPASLQTVEVRTAKQTLTAMITSGADPIFTTAIAASVIAIPFEAGSRRMQATSGIPSPDNSRGGDGTGLVVGLALPILISLVVGVVSVYIFLAVLVVPTDLFL